MNCDEALDRLDSTYHSPLLGIVRAEVERLRAELANATKLANIYRAAITPAIEAEDELDKLKADLAAARADATLLRSTLIDIAEVMGMSSLPSYSEWEKIRNKALQLVAALAGEKK